MLREDLIKNLECQSFDVIVIGGGATGFGAAVDAASRGFKTLLLEQSDFGKATSSKSTKLIHGGIRYLKHGKLKLVKESLQERSVLINNAPHLVHPLPFIIPAYSWLEKLYYYMGVKAYDLLASKHSIGKSTVLTSKEISKILPNLKTDSLRGGFLFFDGQFDDCKMLIALANTLIDLNGTPLNYFKMINFIKNAGQIIGVEACDLETEKSYKLFAPTIINATGVFTDEVRNLDENRCFNMVLASQGTHIVVDKKLFPSKTALIIPATDDKRVIFVIPWKGKVLIGTTDIYVKKACLEPKFYKNEVRFLLTHISRYLKKKIDPSQILSVFSGLRPLVSRKEIKITARISRDHTVVTSKSGLITIAGGKWTSYRKMGQDVINQAVSLKKLPKRNSQTENLHLHGWKKLPKTRLEKSYRSNAKRVKSLIEEDPCYKEQLHQEFPFLKGEVIWAIRKEMARSIEDLLARRLRILFLDANAAISIAPQVATLMAKELCKNKEWEIKQVQDFKTLAQNYLFS